MTRVVDMSLVEGALAPDRDRMLAFLKRGDTDLEVNNPPDLRGGLDERVVGSAITTWQLRMVNEHRSSTVFASLLPQLVEASFGVDKQLHVLRMAADEIHHAVLCGAVVRALGGNAVAHAEPVLPMAARHAGVSPRERVLRNVLFVGCLAETVAVALVGQERELAQHPYVRAVLDQILADEVRHARFGWQFVSDTLPTLGEGARARTSSYLLDAFAFLEHEELPLLPLSRPCSSEVRAQRESLALCDGAMARDLFYACVQDVILPRLDALGLAASHAWQFRHQRAA